MKTVGIIQARCGSTRLPRKILMDLGGEPMLARVVARLRRAEGLDMVVVATTTDAGDDEVETLCRGRNWACYRGCQDDVLDRYYQAAQEYEAQAVVRVTGDCPLIDPGVVDLVVGRLHAGRPAVDYVSNIAPTRTYPRGLDTEALTFAALQRTWREAKQPAFREHVTPYIHQHPELFVMQCVTHDRDFSRFRWTVDTAEDMELARRVYEHFGHDGFSWLDVLAAMEQHPRWQDINSHVRQKEI